MRVCANIALTPSLRIVAGAACLFWPLNLVADGCRWSLEGAALIRALARSAAVRELRHPLCGLHGLPGPCGICLAARRSRPTPTLAFLPYLAMPGRATRTQLMPLRIPARSLIPSFTKHTPI